MNIPGIQWSPSEASAINEFLNTPVGRKWLGVLMARKPRMDLRTTESAALTGAFAAGYEHAVMSEIPATRIAMKADEDPGRPAIDTTKD